MCRTGWPTLPNAVNVRPPGPQHRLLLHSQLLPDVLHPRPLNVEVLVEMCGCVSVSQHVGHTNHHAQVDWARNRTRHASACAKAGKPGKPEAMHFDASAFRSLRVGVWCGWGGVVWGGVGWCGGVWREGVVRTHFATLCSLLCCTSPLLCLTPCSW